MKPAPSDRPLLRAQRAATPEQMTGMNEGQDKFKPIGDLSDSGEEPMQLDSDADEQDNDDECNGERPNKRIALSISATTPSAGNSGSRWSNPDPYTVLPPPDDSQGKRKDVVQLIRKARASTNDGKSSTANDNDFISFDLDGQADENSSTDEDSGQGVPGAPTGPRFSHLDRLHSDRVAPGAGNSSLAANALGPPPAPPPDLYRPMKLSRGEKDIDIWPPRDIEPDTTQKSRKRGREQFNEETTYSQDRFARSGNSTKYKNKIDGHIVPEWRASHRVNSTPWYTVDHSDTEDVGFRLHKEICDFYEYVKPKEFENTVRSHLIGRVGDFLRNMYPQGEVRFFGSFAAGLYLPTSDMDLVVLSKHFQKGGLPSFCQSNSAMRRFASDLNAHRVAKKGTVVPVFGAKVPIVKYVDKETDLKVDISFENNTGPIANSTYNNWKVQFPAMPIIVTLIKQFLCMRGMNEVFNGGLGGFSVTCLVVSLMQHMPQLQSGNMNAMQNLGEVFMTFLDFYGSKFNTTTTGIQMNPPQYFAKVSNAQSFVPGIAHFDIAYGHACAAQSCKAVGSFDHRS